LYNNNSKNNFSTKIAASLKASGPYQHFFEQGWLQLILLCPLLVCANLDNLAEARKRDVVLNHQHRDSNKHHKWESGVAGGATGNVVSVVL
jgi:hypothetical protein